MNMLGLMAGNIHCTCNFDNLQYWLLLLTGAFVYITHYRARLSTMTIMILMKKHLWPTVFMSFCQSYGLWFKTLPMILINVLMIVTRV